MPRKIRQLMTDLGGGTVWNSLRLPMLEWSGMIRMPKNPKRPRDPNQLAKLIVDMSTGDESIDPKQEKNAAAVALGRLGGLKGGKARADSLTPAQRKEIAQKAAAKRWKKDGDRPNE